MVTRIVRIMYAKNTVCLIDHRGGLQECFKYDEWQKWLRENGTLNLPFVYNIKTKEAEYVQ
jgi:hypothetical protein